MEIINLRLMVRDEKGRPLEAVKISVGTGGKLIGTAFTDQTGLARIVLDVEFQNQKIHYKAERRGFQVTLGEIELKGETLVKVTMGRQKSHSELKNLRWASAALLAAAVIVAAVIYPLLPSKEVQIHVFRAEPSQIKQREVATLRWETSHASSVTVAGTSVAPSGSMEVSPRRTTEYTLFAKNERGEARGTVTVQVSIPRQVLEGLVRQFIKVYMQLRSHPSGAELVDVEDPFEALMATGSKNEILEEGCRQEALDFALETLRAGKGLEDQHQARQLAEEHLSEQRQASSNASYQEVFKHISECKNFCRPWTARLLLCHVQSVAEHQPEIVLFPTNSRYVAPDYSRGILSGVAEKLRQDPMGKVWLVGRASKLGPPGYNRKLSLGRALAVKEDLARKGIAPSRIEILSLGYEPPQITYEIAKEYGVEELYLAEGEQWMNQSVVLVVY